MTNTTNRTVGTNATTATGRFRRTGLRRLCAVAGALACAGPLAGLAPAPVPLPAPADGAGVDIAAPGTLFIGPVPGLTLGWHLAPQATAIPQGVVVVFKVAAPSDASVTWSGADEFARDKAWSMAACKLMSPGAASVSVDVGMADEIASATSNLTVVDVATTGVHVSPIAVTTGSLTIDEELPPAALNAATMAAYAGASIAAVKQVGAGLYRTSLERPVSMGVTVHPAAFAPLVEWRVDGAPRALGVSASLALQTVGKHELTAGPPGAPASVFIETYGVEIVEQSSGEIGDLIPQGKPVVFVAMTNPPGYESEITWLASTMYGVAAPVLGQGPMFVAQFDDTVGPWPNNPSVPFEWLGVKADHALLGQDQKGHPCCFDVAPNDDYHCEMLLTSLECAELGGTYLLDAGMCGDPGVCAGCPSESTLPRAPASPRFRMEVGPVAGLTTDWQPATQAASVPKGAAVDLRVTMELAGDLDGNGVVDLADLTAFRACFNSQGTDGCHLADLDGDGDVDPADYAAFDPLIGAVGTLPDLEVRWLGADSVVRSPAASIARATLGAVGVRTIEAQAWLDGAFRTIGSIRFSVVDVAAEAVTVAIAAPVPYVPDVADEPNLDALATFLSGSQADVLTIGPAHHLTSVNRNMRFAATTDPPGFEPWIEWRSDGRRTCAAGSSAVLDFAEGGDHIVSAGIGVARDTVRVTTYRTIVTTKHEFLADGTDIHFEAVTEPPGFEHLIRWSAMATDAEWISSEPVGPTFTIRFDNVEPDATRWRLVRANEDANEPQMLVVASCGDCPLVFPTKFSAGCCNGRIVAAPCNPPGPATKTCNGAFSCGLGIIVVCGCK